MFDLTVDTSELNKAMALFAKETKKGLDEVIEKQAAMIVGHLITMTPPGDKKAMNRGKSGQISNAAKKRGEAVIRGDINSLFPTTRKKSPEVWGMIENGFYWGAGRGKKKIIDFAESMHDLRRVHKFARSPSTGRVRTGANGYNMALTRSPLRTAFIREQIKKVGMLSAGWLRAAEELGTAKSQTPTWIRRHGKKPGGADFRRSKHGLSINIRNGMPYFPKNIGYRMQRAVNQRAYGITKALESMAERKAKAAERRMNR